METCVEFNGELKVLAWCKNKCNSTMNKEENMQVCKDKEKEYCTQLYIKGMSIVFIGNAWARHCADHGSLHTTISQGFTRRTTRLSDIFIRLLFCFALSLTVWIILDIISKKTKKKVIFIVCCFCCSTLLSFIVFENLNTFYLFSDM